MARPARTARSCRRHFRDELSLGRALALGRADLNLRAQPVIDLPVGVERDVAALRGGFAINHVVHRVVGTRGACVRCASQHAVLHGIAGLRRLAACEVAAPEHEIAVVVVGIHVGEEAAQPQGQAIGRLVLHFQQSAGAIANLFEQRRTDQAGNIDADEIRVRGSNRVIIGDLEEAARNLLRIAAKRTLLLEHL